MRLSELLKKEEYTSDFEVCDLEIERISTKQDEIDEKTLFVVIKSIKFDVTKIINNVLIKKPAAILCEEDIRIEESEIPILYAKNTRLLLSYLYARYNGVNFEKTTFIGVTGTNGKTTTATMIAHILSHAERRVGFIGTGKILINGEPASTEQYSMTTPDPDMLYEIIRKMQNAECEFVVMEVSSHALYFDKVAPIPFSVSVFTNLSEEHLDFHKDLEEYYRCKLKLFTQTKVGVFNLDDKYSARAMQESHTKKIGIGIIQDAPITARDVTMNGLYGTEYIYREKHRLFKVKSALGGAYNVYNSMLAITAAIELGIKPCVAKEAISTLKQVDGRLEIIHDDVVVIIDYAHTASAITNVLKLINSAKNKEQKLITVFGCGGERDKSKRPKMAKAAETYSDFVIVTSDNSRGESESEIIEDILSGFKSSASRKVISSRASAIEYAILSADSGDIIALIGKGHERYNIDKNGYHYFNEKEIADRALKKRKAEVRCRYENNPEDNSDA